MGNNCCSRSELSFDINTEKEALLQQYEEINRSFNPFFYHSLSMIEKQEQKLINSGKQFLDFINTEYSYILNAQFKLAYSLCKEDLEKIIDNKNVYDIIFYNLVFLTLSSSHNLYYKKEELCLSIVNKVMTKGSTDYSLFIDSIKHLSSICSKIVICFVFFNLIIDVENVEADYETLFIQKESLQFTNSLKEEIIGLALRKKLSDAALRDRVSNVESPFIKLNFDNFHQKFFDCMLILYPNIKIYYPFEKFLDKTVNQALNKLFYRKNIFSDLNSEEIKTIIDDVIDVILSSNLFGLMLK